MSSPELKHSSTINEEISNQSSWSVDADADHLMDDLFSDIDYILENGAEPPQTKTVVPQTPTFISLDSLVVPSMVLGPKATEEEQALDENPSQENPSHQESLAVTPSKPKRLDKVLFLLAALSLFGVIGWLIRQERFNFLLPATLTVEDNTAALQLKQAQDQEFVAYLQRSIPAIEQQITKAEAEKSPTPNQTQAQIPANSPPTVPPTIVERVYIPLAPTNSPSNGASTPTPAPGTTPTPSNLEQALLPSPKPIPKPVPTNKPPVNVALPEAPLNLEPPSFNPGVVPLPLPAINSAVPTSVHTLVGLLESGQNSAALFEVEGSTQRVRVGEAIGGSGWTLVSVANQKAVIRRNGEIRSIYAGQQF